MTSAIDWALYRSFLAVLDEGSLSGAARALGITQPTVGRHIEALERALGLVLFTRSQTGLLATEAAASLRGHLQAMSSTAASLEREALSHGGSVIKGVVRISCSDVIGVEVLPPTIVRLREAHPELRVELVLTDRVQDLLQREADIAVRMVEPTQGQLVARRIGAIELGLFAHRDYLARHGAPSDPAQLAGHAAIGYDTVVPYIRRLEQKLPGIRREAFSLRSDNALAQLALLRAGAGVGMCQVPLGLRDPALQRLLPEAVSVPLECWVTMHDDLRGSPRCRATFDALVEGLQAYVGS